MNLKDDKYQVEIKNGNQFWRDANGNVIHVRNSDGFEVWHDYDANGNWIHFKDSDGFETWYDYDAKGNMIHSRNSKGDEVWYDSNGKEISKKEFDKIHNKKSDSCEGTVVEVMGKKYKLTAV